MYYFTNFMKAKELMEVLNVPTTEGGPPTVELQCIYYNVLEEELADLKTALASQNLTEIESTLIHILYGVYTLGHLQGINLDEAMAITHNNNMETYKRND